MKLFQAGVLAIALSGTALAVATVAPFGDNGALAQSQTAPMLTDDQIRIKLQEQGYSNVQNVLFSRNGVTAVATKDGRTMTLAVDPHNGQVVRLGEADDDDDD